MSDKLAQLTSLLRRVWIAKGSDRRLDYELFCLFAEMEHGNLWDPREGNDFTSSSPLRRCAAEALHARIREAKEMADAR